jgi:hypothetical protein
MAPDEVLPARNEFGIEAPERDHSYVIRYGPCYPICLQARAVHGHPGFDGPSVGSSPGAIRSVDQSVHFDAILDDGTVGLGFLEYAANEGLGVEARSFRRVEGSQARRMWFERPDFSLAHQIRAHAVLLGAPLQFVQGREL